MNQNRRLGDRRGRVRRQSNEIIDGLAPSPHWPFPVYSDQILCAACGQRFRGSHVCMAKK